VPNLFSARRQTGAGLLVPVLALAVGLLASNADAHPVLAQPKAEAGSFYKAAIGITHGCKGSATREVIVRIPEGVQGAKPMPKPGWTIAVERAKLAQPRESHGLRVTEDVAQIRWSGGTLPNDQYDEFNLVATLPARAGTLYWQVSQVCNQGRSDWREIPAAGQDAKALESPALRMEVLPAAPAAHAHH
jgi:uncharacterized protein YcnI